MNWFKGKLSRVVLMLISLVVFAIADNAVVDNLAAGLFIIAMVILFTEIGTRDVTTADKQSRLGHTVLPRRK